MKKWNFFALVHRLRHINRWGLMRNTCSENVCEHSMHVAVLTHALAAIGRDVFKKAVSPERLACAALFHDCSEIYTGDMPTPVKYLNSELKNAYKDAERKAKDKLVSALPEELRKTYAAELFFEEAHPGEYAYVKAADKLAAYIKCLEERSGGNGEFSNAEESTLKILEGMARQLPELEYFMEKFLPGYNLTLDEL